LFRAFPSRGGRCASSLSGRGTAGGTRCIAGESGLAVDAVQHIQAEEGRRGQHRSSFGSTGFRPAASASMSEDRRRDSLSWNLLRTFRSGGRRSDRTVTRDCQRCRCRNVVTVLSCGVVSIAPCEVVSVVTDEEGVFEFEDAVWLHLGCCHPAGQYCCEYVRVEEDSRWVRGPSLGGSPVADAGWRVQVEEGGRTVDGDGVAFVWRISCCGFCPPRLGPGRWAREIRSGDLILSVLPV